MKQDVAVISLDAYAGQFYAQQVQELFGERITVCSYSVRDGSIEHMPRRYDLYMVTTDAFDSLGDLHQYVPIDGEMMEIHVTLRWDVVRRLQSLPAGKRALFVNLSDKMCREAVTRLNQLGVNQLVFDLYHPGAPEPDMGQYDFVITPQETRYVPAGAKEIIDIGQRVCDSSTMIEAALRLGLEELLESERFEQHQREVATNTYSFDRVFARGLRLESQFEVLMEILDEGIVGVNERGEVFACNRKLEEITCIPCGEALHRPAGAVYPFLPFARCLKEKAPQPARVVSAGGVNINVAVAPVLRGDACIGAFATVQRFNDAENRQNELRSQLLHKGYRAKYGFDDVVGVSEGIERTKQILRRMAVTKSPVLLIGETGTGKELFANAVHQASRRSKGPFVAINCAAMPENLLESELFGYEEGAFTGAKKGGRPGLFEFAHHGTLFLDEVEGVSPALQVKLLRVLQEHEIMRVGGNKNISIDVRIVAATNESLEEKVRDGSFRRDLYYRLNTLPVLIPPLRQRGDDVFLLMERFNSELKGDFVLSDEVKDLFLHYSWPGNIRELRNLAEYFSFTGSPVITVKDLPPTFVYENKEMEEGQQVSGTTAPGSPRPGSPVPWQQAMEEKGIDSEEYWFVLKVLYQCTEERKAIGREGILECAKKEKFFLSQIGVRTILGILKEYGLARVSRGRGGSRMTCLGREIWEHRE